MKNSVNK